MVTDPCSSPSSGKREREKVSPSSKRKGLKSLAKRFTTGRKSCLPEQLPIHSEPRSDSYSNGQSIEEQAPSEPLASESEKNRCKTLPDPKSLVRPTIERRVAKCEQMLRFSLLLMVAYTAGTKYPEFSSIIFKLGEYIFVAWLTCAVLQVSSPSALRDESIALKNTPIERFPLIRPPKASEFIPPVEVTSSDYEMLLETESVDTQDFGGGLDPYNKSTPSAVEQYNVHPSLERFFIIDVKEGTRVLPNDVDKMHRLDNDLFEGKMLVMIRTPDVDDKNAPIGDTANRAIARHFHEKQRRFEFQFQFRLKRIPKGQVYFACELDEPVKIGVVQRAFVGAAMAFVKATNKNFQYSITGSKKSQDGKYELPHMAFPIEEGMSRIIITKEGETIPTLGGTLRETDEDTARRKKGGKIVPELGVTYTMALWSAYFDYIQWKCINLPGIRPFKLTSVVGNQSLRIVLYEVPEKTEKHYRKLITPVLELELSNTDESACGSSASKWMESSSNLNALSHLPVVTSDLDLLGTSEGGEYGLEVADAIDSDDEAIAELGQGIYVKSGDKVTLRESNPENSGDRSPSNGSSFVSSGGGFAVLQEQGSVSIVIEKIRKRGRSRRTKRDLIRSGDTVRFKLVTLKSNGGTETKFLTTHRGWWLKWASGPSKMCNFIIYTHETEFSVGEEEVRSSETQSSFLTLGGSFWLSHKRWSKCMVGVAGEESAAYGGRLLGLYSAKDGTGLSNDLSDDGDPLTDEEQLITRKGKKKGDWIKPLQLRAYESFSSTVAPRTDDDNLQANEVLVDLNKATSFSCDDHGMDVPVWLEMMNRTERTRQLVYVVRVLPSDEPSHSTEEGSENDSTIIQGAFFRLRTGSNLSQLMRVGLNWRNSANREVPSSQTPSSPGSQLASKRRIFKRQDSTRSLDGIDPGISLKRRTLRRQDSASSLDGIDLLKSPKRGDLRRQDSANSLDGIDDEEHSRHRTFSREWSTSSLDGVHELFQVDDDNSEVSDWGACEDAESVDEMEHHGNSFDAPKNTKRHIIGKIAKSVKRRGTSTGKTVVRGSLKVGKGTVSVGRKAIITPGKAIMAPIRSKNPPLNAPKVKKTDEKRNRKRQERDLQLAVSRSMKGIESAESKTKAIGSPSFLAGELSAAEQSCRTVSRMLSRMSDIPRESPLHSSFSQLLYEQVSYESEQDSTFLQGDAVHLGVVPSISPLKGDLLLGCVVARCLWESHWREEWCGLYQHTGIELYTPMSQSPCTEILYQDIRSIRAMNNKSSRSPLPGLPMLVIETAWQCHYLVFLDISTLELFKKKALEFQDKLQNQEVSKSTDLDEKVSKAHFWQGFQNSLESSLSAGKGKWAEVTVGKRHKRRIILNRRRMEFDLEYLNTKPEKVVEELLTLSLSYSPDYLAGAPHTIVPFLDLASKLRLLRLNDVNLQSPQALCTFINLYHCLLQHTLLLSVNGTMNKRSFELIMTTSCYEIGGDVFSLAELQSIIRNNVSKLQSVKPPFVDVPKKSRSYRYYALGYSTPLVLFSLNTAHVSFSRSVTVLTTENMEAVFNRNRMEYLRLNIEVDESKKSIVLPKLCEVFKHAFTDQVTTRSILQYCLPYLDESVAIKVRRLQREEGNSLSLKYQFLSDDFHLYLNRELTQQELPKDSSESEATVSGSHVEV